MRYQPSSDRFLRKSLFISIALVSFIASAQAQTATEILAKVSSVYAGCRTYSDEGTNIIEARDAPTRQASFRTSFIRPDAFRFQVWLNSDKPGTSPWFAWKSGDVIRGQAHPSHSGAHNLRFDSALLRMASFSGGSSIAVPQLLLPDAFRILHLFSLIAGARVAGEEKIDGRQSFRIEGTIAGLPIKLWIDKSQYLILKSYRKVIIGNREEESIVLYKPRLNVAVPPEDLTLPQSRDQTVAWQTSPKSLEGLAPKSPQILARPPRLRNFGSSLSRAEKAGANTERPADDEDVVRIETDLVVSPVLVIDAQGKTVRGLTAEDFIVKEDDRLQQVATFSLGDNQDLPRSIVLVIDYSVSQLPYIRTSIESAKMLVDKLNPKDRMAVVTDDVQLLVDFTSDKQLLKTQLESLKTTALSGRIGASEQYDALLASLNELFNNEDVRPIIIFQTDGDQLDSLKDGKGFDPYWPSRKYSLEDILTVTEKTRASVYSVISGVKFVDVPEDDLVRRVNADYANRQNAGFDLNRAMNKPVPNLRPPSKLPDKSYGPYIDRWQRLQKALVGLAKFTGTIPEFLEEPGQADEIYTRILTDIDRRYVIGYYPTNRSRDGKRRKVSVEVRGHPEYTVWGQKAYFAKEEK